MFRNSSPGRSGLILAAVSLVSFMVSVDISVVNVGLPQIAAGLGFGASGLQWVIHAYALTFGGLLLLGGKAADRYGHRRILVLGLVLFGLSSLLGGLAQEPGQLIAARAAQGVGAAALSPASLALLAATFPTGRARVRAYGVWTAMNGAGAALGVLIGGVLTEYAGWRWVMFVSVPMAAAALLATVWGVAAVRRQAPAGPPDVLGAILATAGMTLLVFGIVRTDQHPWTSATTLGTLGIALALLTAFVLVERTTSREKLVRLGLFANRNVTGANAYNLLLGGALTSSFYFMSLYVQRVLGAGPALAGVEFLPFALGIVAGAALGGRLGHRLPSRSLLVVGGLLAAAGFAWFGLITSDGLFIANILGPSIVASVGVGLAFGPVVSTGTLGVAAHETGVASGLLASSRQIGASLGLAALGTAAQHRIGSVPTPEAQAHGYAFGLVLCSVLVVCAVLVALTVLRRTDSPALVHHLEPEGAAVS